MHSVFLEIIFFYYSGKILNKYHHTSIVPFFYAVAQLVLIPRVRRKTRVLKGEPTSQAQLYFRRVVITV